MPTSLYARIRIRFGVRTRSINTGFQFRFHFFGNTHKNTIHFSLSLCLAPPPATTVAAGDHRATTVDVAGKTPRDSKSKSANGVMFISTPRSKPLNRFSHALVQIAGKHPEPPRTAAHCHCSVPVDWGHLRLNQAHHRAQKHPATKPRPRDGPDDAGKEVRRRTATANHRLFKSVTFLYIFREIDLGKL